MLHVNCTSITWLNTWALELELPDGKVFQELVEITVITDMVVTARRAMDATVTMDMDIKFILVLPSSTTGTVGTVTSKQL